VPGPTPAAPADAGPDSPFARAADAVHLVGLSYFLCLALAGWRDGRDGAGGAAAAFACLAAALLLLRRAATGCGGRPAPTLAVRLHRVATLLILPAVFSALALLVPSLPERRFDEDLAALDAAWFGADVPRWSERVLGPGLADAMMIFYAAYFLMPLALLGGYVARRDVAGIPRACFTVAVGLYATYALYLLVPAAGPRHAYVGLSEPLPRGLVAGALHDLIRDLEPQPWDAFPSAHVVLGLLCAALAWPFGGALRWGMAFVAAGTVASTLFLRYHWIVDDVAGVVVAAGALAAARLLGGRAARRSARKAEAERGRMDDLLAA
jgi:membrane-associated phospholipid phosphatase